MYEKIEEMFLDLHHGEIVPLSIEADDITLDNLILTLELKNDTFGEPYLDHKFLEIKEMETIETMKKTIIEQYKKWWNNEYAKQYNKKTGEKL